jgi:Ca-activated chloride channel family protein
MKKIILYIIASFISLSSYTQNDKIKGNLTTSDTADLTILNIYPDAFPNVSVVFKAETRKGNPVWDLTKEKMKVKENSQECKVISLERISKTKPINIAIVLDHSGSMLSDEAQLFDKDGLPLYTETEDGYLVFPKNYVAPIDNAKKAAKSFISSFNFKKDFMSVIGFSTFIDIQLPLSQDINEINGIIDSMQADNTTALYDAMIAGIEQIKKSEGIKLLVVLTDGYDNASKTTWSDVVDKAKQEEIPVYIIGLGDVNTDTLQLIAKSTKGQFYFTKSSSSLNGIYALISKQVQAFYNLVYTSPNFSSMDSTRQIELSFDVDDMFLVTNAESINLPSEVISFIEKKEKEKEYIYYGGIASALLIGAGVILFYVRRNKKDESLPIILKLFPNPAFDVINVECKSKNGRLQIIDMTGTVVKSFELECNEAQFNISDIKLGNYIAIIER